MREVVSRRYFLKLGVLGAVGVSATGCGSILYPERIGQPHYGALDWKVVALDTLGLLCFFIPGVIAFVVDFANGTIYLPAGQCANAGERFEPNKFVSVQVPPHELDRARIEQVVSKQTAKEVQLNDGAYRTQPVQHLDEFWTLREPEKPVGQNSAVR